MNFHIKQIKTVRRNFLTYAYDKMKQNFINFANYFKSTFFVKNLGKSQLYTAFTLAEVIIVIGIIGIIAQFTIPTLISNFQKQETVNRLRKVYTTLQQSINLSIIDNGDVSTWNFGTLEFDSDEALNFTNTYLTPYLKILKNCGKSATECTTKNRKYLDGRTNDIYAKPSTTANIKLILNDGSLLWINTHSGTVTIIVDTNGDKAPNSFGRDTFSFNIKSTMKNIEFWGNKTKRELILTSSSWDNCNKKSASMAGFCCGTIIQQDSWQIAQDYPWN